MSPEHRVCTPAEDPGLEWLFASGLGLFSCRPDGLSSRWQPRFRQEHQAPLSAAVPDPPEGAAVQATAADSEWDKEPDPKTPERPRRQSLEGKDSILDKAKVEIQRYTKFCICDISDAASMEAALQGMLGCSDSSAAACTHKNLKPG